ncbi:MAG: EpsG family protein [Clostridia bacterium]|nr:EpsG family protein [Clostridia bacterium]
MLHIFLALTVGLFYYFKNYTYSFADIKVGILNDNKTKGNKTSYIAIVLLILFAALRSCEVGYDVANYRLNFDLLAETHEWSEGHGFEFGFQIITFLIAILYKGQFGFTLTMIIYSSIIVLCADYATKKLTKNNTLAMFLFVTIDTYFRGLNQIRQMIAVSILMIAMVFVKEKKLLKYVVTCLIAALFHKVALIFIPLYFLFTINFKYYLHYILIALVAAVFCLFNGFIIKIISLILNLDLYDKYILTNYGIMAFSLVGYLEVFAYACAFIFFLVYKIIHEKKYEKIKNNTYRNFLDLFFCSVMFLIVSLILHRPEHYGRLAYYFFWSLIFLVPAFLHTIKNKKIKVFFTIGIVCVAIMYLYFSINIVDAYGVANYLTFWE